MFLGKSSHVFMTAPTGAALRSDGPVPFEPGPSLEVEANGMMVSISLDLTKEGSVSGGMIHDVFLTFVLVVSDR
jgi:hypothetical protein